MHSDADSALDYSSASEPETFSSYRSVADDFRGSNSNSSQRLLNNDSNTDSESVTSATNTRTIAQRKSRSNNASHKAMPITGATSINAASGHISLASSSSSASDRNYDDHFHDHPRHTCCCCFSPLSPATRSLHCRFLKALCITFTCLLLVLLFGFLLEPLFIDDDGWMDCLDTSCEFVVPRPGRTVTMKVWKVGVPVTHEPLIVAAYHRVDAGLPAIESSSPSSSPSSDSLHSTLTSPHFFTSWHERTVSDYLDNEKLKKEVKEMEEEEEVIEEGGVRKYQARRSKSSKSPSVSSTLYSSPSSSSTPSHLHTDPSRTREIFRGERAMLEKAYMQIVPWLPHHMKLGEPAPVTPNDTQSSSSSTLPPHSAKTTSPLLTRSSLDATTTFLTEHYPDTQWIRVWIVDSMIYIHSWNRELRVSMDGNSSSSTLPTSVFSRSPHRLNNFLNYLLSSLTSSLSTRLTLDALFHSLPQQPSSAVGKEDAFPNVDAVFVLDSKGSVNVRDGKRMEEMEERVREEEKRVRRSRKKESSSSDGDTPILLETSVTVKVHTQGDPGFRDTNTLDSASLETSSNLNGPSSPDQQHISPLLHSILSFTPFYSDETTRDLVLPRVNGNIGIGGNAHSSAASVASPAVSSLLQSLTPQELLRNNLRRGHYPLPPEQFAPLFATRQSAHEARPWKSGGGDIGEDEETSTFLHSPSTPSYTFSHHLFSHYQTLLSSPTLLLPDFNQWNELEKMQVYDREMRRKMVGVEEMEKQMESKKKQDGDGEDDESDDSTWTSFSSIEDGGLSEDVARLSPQAVGDDLTPTPSSSPSTPTLMIEDSSPTIHEHRLHSLHIKQISHLRSTKKILLILQPLTVHTNYGSSRHVDAEATRKIREQMRNEMRRLGVEKIDLHDRHNLESTAAASTAKSSSDSSSPALTLQQRMLHRANLLLQYRLVDIWRYMNLTSFQLTDSLFSGTTVLKDITQLLQTQFFDYTPLKEQREFEATQETGYKLYDKNSVVPESCHLPLVIYEEAESDDLFSSGSKDSTAATEPQPGSWAHWLWRCDYLVLREVQPMYLQQQGEKKEKVSATKSQRRSKHQKQRKNSFHQLPPPLLLPASNTYDEYWSVTYEPYKHYLPFVLSFDDVEEREKENQESGASSSSAHPILTQLLTRAQSLTSTLQSSLPSAYHSQSTILHLLPLLHQLMSEDWTRMLPQPHGGNSKEKHERKGNVWDKRKVVEKKDEDEDKEESVDDTLTRYESLHSCSDHFRTLADSLTCIWCLRVTSRYWMRSVMAPEFIAAYTKKLMTLYSHTLKDPPTREEIESDEDLRKSLTKINTQTDVREWIKSIVFSTQGMED